MDMELIKRIFITILFCSFMNCTCMARNNVVFTIDNNYPVYTLLTINSILLNNKSKSEYTFWIVENNISNINKKIMKNFVNSRHQKINFININTNNIDDGKNLYKATPWSGHVTRIGTARLYIPELLDKESKALYLDSDLLVISDLNELYQTDISGYGVALCKDTIERYRKKIQYTGPTYYNSGVILMNLDYLRKMNATQKMINYIKNNNLFYPDQDSINTVLRKHIKPLNQKWNNQTSELGHPFVSIKNGGIIHYIGSVKPWNVQPNLTHEVRLYYNYWDKTLLRIYQIRRYSTVFNYYNNFCETLIDNIYTKIQTFIKTNFS